MWQSNLLSVLELKVAHLFRHLSLFYPFIKGSSLQPQTTQMFCSQYICSSLVLSSRDTSDSLRQHCCLCFLFISRELPLLGHVSLFWHLFAIIFTRASLFFHILLFQGHESLADHLRRSYLTFHMKWSLNSWIFK